MKMLIGKIVVAACFISGITSGYAADKLLFQPGSQASYVVHKETEFTSIANNIKVDGVTTNDISMDIKILNSNKGALPFELEVIVRKVTAATEVTVRGNTVIKKKYDSTLSSNPDAPIVSKSMEQLVNVPLHFLLNEKFEVVETTGTITEFEKTNGDRVMFECIPVKLNDFFGLFASIFKFANEDVVQDGVFPNKDDDFGTTYYQVKKVKPDQLRVTLVSNGTTPDNKGGTLIYTEEITWNIRNPLFLESSSRSVFNSEIIKNFTVTTRIVGSPIIKNKK